MSDPPPRAYVFELAARKGEHALDTVERIWEELSSAEVQAELRRIRLREPHRGPRMPEVPWTYDRPPEGASAAMLAGWDAADDSRPSSRNPYCAWHQPKAFTDWIDGWLARVEAEPARHPADEDDED